MTRTFKIFGAMATIALVSACGGGSSSDGTGGTGGGTGGGGTGGGGSNDGGFQDGGNPLIPDVDQDTLRVFSDTDGTISDVFLSNGNLFVRDVSKVSVAKTYTGDLNYRSVEAQIGFEADDGDLVVTMRVDGFSEPMVVRIVDAQNIDRNTITFRNDFGAWTFSTPGGGRISDLFDEGSGRYAKLVEVVLSNRDQDFAVDTVAVIGTETRDSMIDTLTANNATATYDGFARMNIRRTDQTFDQFHALAQGQLRLEADFGASSIQGDVTGIELSVDGGTPTALGGSLLLNPGTIDGNSFSGTMSADGALASDPLVGAATADGSYSGAFYGPDADEVGGSMSGGSDGPASLLGFGHFTGTKQ
jgi:hypothetical protein